jgi:hypothetical protein
VLWTSSDGTRRDDYNNNAICSVNCAQKVTPPESENRLPPSVPFRNRVIKRNAIHGYTSVSLNETLRSRPSTSGFCYKDLRSINLRSF